MSQEFEKVSILKDADVSYSGSCKVPQYDLSNVGQPVGDVDVLAWLVSGNGHKTSAFTHAPHGWAHGYKVTDLVDRSHVTRLTAEREELRRQVQLLNEAGEFLDDVSQGIEDQLMAQNVELQSELTKARELLQMLLDTYGYGLRRVDHSNVKAFLAHQSPPAANFIACNVDESCGQNAPAAKGESHEL